MRTLSINECQAIQGGARLPGNSSIQMVGGVVIGASVGVLASSVRFLGYRLFGGATIPALMSAGKVFGVVFGGWFAAGVLAAVVT